MLLHKLSLAKLRRSLRASHSFFTAPFRRVISIHRTHSSAKSAAWVYAQVLFGICAILIALFEISSVYLLRHSSITYKRISQQYSEAIKIRPGGAGEPPSVLMVGNSLLLHGVEVDRLRALTSSQMHVYPVFLEATGYYDWLYALRRMFRHGARPQVVIVGVGVNFLLANRLREDYAPMLFLDARDNLAVASDLHFDHTATSNLMFAHWSTFWDTRAVIRTQILRDIFPHIEDLFTLINPSPRIPVGPELERVAIPRLRNLRELCEAYGAKLIFLVPPTLSSTSAMGPLDYAAEVAGVDISVPIDPAALSEKFYQPDGMHLNSQGAELFTAALARDLPERIMVHPTVASRFEMPADRIRPAGDSVTPSTRNEGP